MKKFHSLTPFHSFPEKLSQLPVTLPILGSLDSNIHGKNFVVTKRSTKTAKLFHRKTKAIYDISFELIGNLKIKIPFNKHLYLDLQITDKFHATLDYQYSYVRR